MADISKVTDLSGITYDIKDTVSRNKVQILPPKTYTGIYATANTDAQKRFFFAKVTRVNKDTLWHVRLRYQFNVPNYPTYAFTDWDADLYGLGSAFKSYYVKVNHGANVAMRYLACAWASPTDNNELYLGAMFYAGQNYNKVAYARDLTVTIMTYDNCEVEYLDSIKKWDEFNTMIYTVTTIDLNANGYQETGDANSTYNLGNNQLYNTVIAKEAIPAESIICAGSDGKYMKVAAGVTFDYTKQLVWLNAAMAVNGTQYVNNFITIYDRNLATSVKPGFSGTANSEVYLVGTINGNEFTVDEEVITTEPYSAGKVYLPIGKLGNQSTGANYFYFNPGVNSVLWEYKNDKLQIYAPPQDVSEKADKVSNATNGNFAALDANGNLTDSGHKHTDYLTSHQDITGKADKVSGATYNNFAALDLNGNLKDSGHKHSDYLTSHQDISGKADKVSNATNGNFAALNASGNLTDSGHKHSDYMLANAQIKTTSLVHQKQESVTDVVLNSKISDLRANRFAFLPADQIIIEETTDGGTTWTAVNYVDSIKTGLFSETRPTVTIPLLNSQRSTLCGVRITFTAMKYNVPTGTPEANKYQYWNSNYVSSCERYNKVNGMYFWVSAAEDRITAKVEVATGKNSDTWVSRFNDSTFLMSGWSGNDYIQLSGETVFGGSITQTTNYWNYRVTFMSAYKSGESTFTGTSKQAIMEIRGYGSAWWTAGNKYAASDHMYSWDYQKNVTFPAKITATDYIGKINGTTVPSNPKFTDTTYESKAAASGGTELSLVTTGEKYTWNAAASGAVHDVQVDNASITVNGVANISTITAAQINALFSSGS